MKILFDMRTVQQHLNRGIGFYCLGLIEGLASAGVQMGYLLDERRTPLPPGLPSGPRYFGDRLHYLDERYDVFLIGNLFSTLYFREADEFFVPSRVRDKVDLVTAMVHDMIPWIERDGGLKWPSLMKKYMGIVAVLNRLDHVFCISESTLDDVVRYAGTLRSITSVIYGSANPGTARRPANYDFDRRANAVVYVGGSMPRKNVSASIEGFAAAYSSGRIPSDSRYYLVYKPDDIAAVRAEAAAAGVADRVIATGFLPDAALDDLIGRCKSTVFPSLYEGLGMPVIESYRLDTPCFVADNSSLRELAPDSCRFDATTVEGLADLFTAALTDKRLCESSIAWGREVSRELTWAKVGKKAHATLEGLLRAKTALARNGRIFIYGGTCAAGPANGEGAVGAKSLLEVVRAAADLYAFVDEGAVLHESGVPRYSTEFLSRGNPRPEPAARLFAIADDAESAETVRECGRSTKNVLYLTQCSYSKLVRALAGGDEGRLRAIAFGSYGSRETSAWIAPIVAAARPRAVIAETEAVLEIAKKDLAGRWSGPVELAPRDGRDLYATIGRLA